MSWQAELLTNLSIHSPGGYETVGPPATEPTALAGLVLASASDYDAAARCADWLCQLQSRDGSVGVMSGQELPQWPTSLAMLTWHEFAQSTSRSVYDDSLARATKFALSVGGKTAPQKQQIGHNTSLVGWSWAEGTHSWLEPTAFFALALKVVGLKDHPRTRQAIELVVDRLLPGGGCNYGNTVVLGQTLLPHVQPTGIALWGLAGENVSDERLGLSLDYLESQLNETTPTASLCFGLLGLTAHNRRPPAAEQWLETAYRREQRRGPTCYKFALLAAAAIPRIARRNGN